MAIFCFLVVVDVQARKVIGILGRHGNQDHSFSEKGINEENFLLKNNNIHETNEEIDFLEKEESKGDKIHVEEKGKGNESNVLGKYEEILILENKDNRETRKENIISKNPEDKKEIDILKDKENNSIDYYINSLCLSKDGNILFLGVRIKQSKCGILKKKKKSVF